MTRVPPITNDRCRPFGACSPQGALAQGSQSVTLGLTMSAATQLVECSHLISGGCD